MTFLNSIRKPMKALLLSPWIVIAFIYFFLTVICSYPAEIIVKYANDINTKALFSGIVIYYVYFLATNLLKNRKVQVKSILIFSIKILAYTIFVSIFFETVNLVIGYSGIAILKDTQFWYNISYLSIYISFYIGYAIQILSSYKNK
ncbi:hypothetical protein [Holzapfeliella sp. JNUCC 72]